MKKESRLQVTTSADGSTSSVEAIGTKKQHIFNLALLTRDICKILNIPPFIMTSMLLEAIAQYERTGNSFDMMMDLNAIRGERGAT